MTSSWIIWIGPKFNDSVLKRDMQRRQAQRRGGGNVIMKAEIGVVATS